MISIKYLTDIYRGILLLHSGPTPTFKKKGCLCKKTKNKTGTPNIFIYTSLKLQSFSFSEVKCAVQDKIEPGNSFLFLTGKV